MTESTDPLDSPTSDRVVLERLQAKTYFEQFPTDARSTSSAYNVFRAIFRRLDGKDVPIKHWYRCSWCDGIKEVNVSTGTQKLLRHIKSCIRRPEGYVLPLRNLHVKPEQSAQNAAQPISNADSVFAGAQQKPQQSSQNATQPISNADSAIAGAQQKPQQSSQNAAQPISDAGSSLVDALDVSYSKSAPTQPVTPATSNSQMSQNVATILTDQSTIKCAQLTNADLAPVLARISRIALLYGNLSEADFLSIMPEDGIWREDFFVQAQKLASEKSGIVSPRVVLKKIVVQKVQGQTQNIPGKVAPSNDESSSVPKIAGNIIPHDQTKTFAQNVETPSTSKSKSVKRKIEADPVNESSAPKCRSSRNAKKAASRAIQKQLAA